MWRWWRISDVMRWWRRISDVIPPPTTASPELYTYQPKERQTHVSFPVKSRGCAKYSTWWAAQREGSTTNLVNGDELSNRERERKSSLLCVGYQFPTTEEATRHSTPFSAGSTYIHTKPAMSCTLLRIEKVLAKDHFEETSRLNSI
ncbi:hypothetical protein JTE90_001867 [Oedothorax gibbosus]|uniref:Uncharacterized protein n=1 Tax=Oedothorax gibbosus TaxID=931172 RepID=A0AAV6VMZ1_9ARAC|nr:hypothetical protein JTE90_001867 [Oedothorax gibbosus]